MGEKKLIPLRIVLDTNCIVSALIFKGAISSRFRRLWQTRRIVPVLCPETVMELEKVMAYPKFSLSPQMQSILLHEIVPFGEFLASIQPIEEIVELADPDDAKFIRLAQKAKTDFLVSGDKHLLDISHMFPDVHIISPGQFLNMHIS